MPCFTGINDIKSLIVKIHLHSTMPSAFIDEATRLTMIAILTIDDQYSAMLPSSLRFSINGLLTGKAVDTLADAHTSIYQKSTDFDCTSTNSRSVDGQQRRANAWMTEYFLAFLFKVPGWEELRRLGKASRRARNFGAVQENEYWSYSKAWGSSLMSDKMRSLNDVSRSSISGMSTVHSSMKCFMSLPCAWPAAVCMSIA